MIAAKCSHAIYVARNCVHWDSKKPLLQLAYQEGKKQTYKTVAKSNILSLSEHQLQRIQENKMRALAKLASNGKQAVSISVNAVDAVSTSVNSVKWSVGHSPMSAHTRLASLSYSRKESVPVALRNKEVNVLKLDLKLYFGTPT